MKKYHIENGKKGYLTIQDKPYIDYTDVYD